MFQVTRQPSPSPVSTTTFRSSTPTRRRVSFLASRFGASGVLSAIGVLAMSSATYAMPPLAELFFSINHGDVKFDFVDGNTNPNGNEVYAASYSSTDGTWLITYQLTVDHTTNPQASMSGIITVENKSPRDTLAFKVGAIVPICPSINGGSLIGGSAVLTLTTVGPGTLSCDKDGLPILDCLGDGHAIESLFYCPTTLTSTGSSTISYSGTFGLPGPSEQGPADIDTVGVSEHFTLTPKDKLSMQINFFFKDSDGVSPPGGCEGDIDGDGIVGPMDLAVLFGNWGQEVFCPSAEPSDLNDDGVVDASDLVLLLSAWGDC